jgi:hypothetical protein
VAVVQYTYTHKQYRERHKNNTYTTQTIHRTTQEIHRTTQKLGWVRAVPRLCGFYPGICRTTEEKARKNLGHNKNAIRHSEVPSVDHGKTVRGTAEASSCSYKKNPTRCNNVLKFYCFIFIWRSTCFGRHTAHHQEPKTALATSGFSYVGSCWTCRWWTWRLPTTRPTSFHVWKTRGCQCSFRLLMMGGVSPGTCWASYTCGIIKFWYTVVSCWIFLYEFYYDARIHEHSFILCPANNKAWILHCRWVSDNFLFSLENRMIGAKSLLPHTPLWMHSDTCTIYLEVEMDIWHYLHILKNFLLVHKRQPIYETRRCSYERLIGVEFLRGPPLIRHVLLRTCIYNCERFDTKLCVQRDNRTVWGVERRRKELGDEERKVLRSTRAWNNTNWLKADINNHRLQFITILVDKLEPADCGLLLSLWIT